MTNETVKQIKLFSNPSFPMLEDLINDWLVSQANQIQVIKITEIRNTESPTFLIEYIVNLAFVEKRKIPFKMVSEINAKRK